MVLTEKELKEEILKIEDEIKAIPKDEHEEENIFKVAYNLSRLKRENKNFADIYIKVTDSKISNKIAKFIIGTSEDNFESGKRWKEYTKKRDEEYKEVNKKDDSKK